MSLRLACLALKIADAAKAVDRAKGEIFAAVSEIRESRPTGDVSELMAEFAEAGEELGMWEIRHRNGVGRCLRMVNAELDKDGAA